MATQKTRMDAMETKLDALMDLLAAQASGEMSTPKASGRKVGKAKRRTIDHSPTCYWATWDGGPEEGEVVAWTHDRTVTYKPAVQMNVDSPKFEAFMAAIEGSQLHKDLTEFVTS